MGKWGWLFLFLFMFYFVIHLDDFMRSFEQSSPDTEDIPELKKLIDEAKENVNYLKQQMVKSKSDSNLKIFCQKTDYTNPVVRNLAVNLASKYPGERNILQIQAIYSYVKKNWKYVNDPRGFEYVAYASETIRNGFAGDCDDYAVTMSALGSAVGFKMRIILGCDKEGCHAYPEIFLGKDSYGKNMIDYLSKTLVKLGYDGRVYYHVSSDGSYWLSLDWTSPHIGGKPMVSEVKHVIYPVECKIT